MLRRYLLILGVIGAACGGRAAAGADARLDMGNGHAALVDERGVIRVLTGDVSLLREVFLGAWVKDDFVDQLQAVKCAGAERDGMLVRTGQIPGGLRYEVFARTTPPGPDGLSDLLLTYVVETLLFPEAKAAVLVRFPVPAFASKTVFLGNAAVGAFPAEQGETPWAARRAAAREINIKDGNQTALFIGRQDTGEVLVQDARRWGAGAYEAQLYLMPTRSQAPSRRILHLIVSLSERRGPTVASLTTNRPPAAEDKPPALPRFGKLEITADLWARFDNPYDGTEIEVIGLLHQPDRAVHKVRGFFFQDFERSSVNGREVLTPVGPPRWRVRLTPTQVGEHTYTVGIKTKGGEYWSKPYPIYVVESDTPGYVSVHTQNPKFFQFSNGKTLFLLGHNVCWGSEEKRSYDYDTYFRRMSHAGENYTRVWMCSWDTGIESDRLDNYRLDAAWRLDYILALAEQRGIYVKLCFDNAHDYTKPEKRKLFGYWKENNGPCEKPVDFFTSEGARAAYKRRLDYIVARWGYSPNIMAWELWNEVNYVTGDDPAARAPIVDWTDEMARYLKANDPHRHLVTTSLGLHTVWDEVWQLDSIDFAQIHAYIPKPQDIVRDEEKDAVLTVLRAAERIARFGKPYHVAEFGYLDLEAANRTNESDPGGIHLHNAIWGGLFSGAAGTPASWWWEYVHDRNLCRHYAAVAGFLADIDLADRGWNQIAAAGASDHRILGIRKRDACAMWIQRKGNDWYRRIVERKPVEPLGELKIRVPDVEPGKYLVIWWDTTGGEITRHPQLAAPREGTPNVFDLVLERKMNVGGPDIAVKARKFQ